MKLKLNEDIKEYLREVRNFMPFRFRPEKKFLKEFRLSVEKFVGDDDNITRADVQHRFGSPFQVVNEYLYSLDQHELGQRTSLRRLVRRTAALLLILLLLLATIRYGTAFLSYWKGAHQEVIYTYMDNTQEQENRTDG